MGKWVKKMKNEKRLIDPYALTIHLAQKNAKHPLQYDDVLAVIADEKRVDAVEVVHGQWKRSPTSQTLYCGVCDKIPDCQIETDYCPKCGAKMDGDKDSNLLFADMEEIIDA